MLTLLNILFTPPIVSKICFLKRSNQKGTNVSINLVQRVLVLCLFSHHVLYPLSTGTGKDRSDLQRGNRRHNH